VAARSKGIEGGASETLMGSKRQAFSTKDSLKGLHQNPFSTGKWLQNGSNNMMNLSEGCPLETAAMR
jgi:hypothetical protein